MKNILLASILFLILFQCKEKELTTLSIKEELKAFSKPPEKFIIYNTKTDTLQTPSGTRLIIPQYTFINLDGSQVTEPIEIEIKEVFKPSEMILNGITTMSDESQLASLGMVKLDVKSNGKELMIKDGQSMMLTIPNNTILDEGELFYGVEDEKGINWEYAGDNKDTIEVVDTIIPLSYGRDSVARLTYKYENGKRVLLTDSTSSEQATSGMDGLDRVAIPFNAEYEFKITKLGWINCDRFLDVKDKVKLTLKLKEFSHPYGYLVFPEINSVMPIYFNESTALLSNLPNKVPSNIVIIDKVGDEFMWVNHEFILGVTDELTLSLTKIQKEKLSEEFRKFDK